MVLQISQAPTFLRGDFSPALVTGTNMDDLEVHGKL